MIMKNGKLLIVLLSVLLVSLSGCSDQDEMHLVQQDFACKDRGGAWLNSSKYRSVSVTSVKCNDGTWQKYNNIELPKDLWMNKAN